MTATAASWVGPTAHLRIFTTLACGAAAAGLGILTGFRPEMGLAAAAAALVLLGIALRPDLATLLAIALIYSNAAVVASRFHGIPYFAASVIPMLFVIPLAHRIIVRREQLVVTPALRLMFVLFFVHIVGTLFSRAPALAFEEVVRFVGEGLVIVLLLTQAIRTAAMLRAAVWVLLLVGGALGTLSIVQQVTGTFDNSYLGFAQVGETEIRLADPTLAREELQPRLEGPVGEKNRYAQVMIVLVPLGLFRVRGERSPAARALAAAATTVITLAVLLTYSRGAAVAFLLLLGVAAVLRYARTWHLVACLLAIAAVFAIVPGYIHRISTLQDVPALAAGQQISSETSIGLRTNSTLAAVAMFRDHPVLGVGPGLYATEYRAYAPRVGGIVGTADFEAHTLYLEIAAEQGVIGTVTYAALFAVVLVALARGRRRWIEEQPELANLASGFFLAVIAYLATGLFLHLSYHRYLWLLMGLAIAAAWIVRPNQGAPAASESPPPLAVARPDRFRAPVAAPSG